MNPIANALNCVRRVPLFYLWSSTFEHSTSILVTLTCSLSILSLPRLAFAGNESFCLQQSKGQISSLRELTNVIEAKYSLLPASSRLGTDVRSSVRLGDGSVIPDPDTRAAANARPLDLTLPTSVLVQPIDGRMAVIFPDLNSSSDRHMTQLAQRLAAQGWKPGQPLDLFVGAPMSSDNHRKARGEFIRAIQEVLGAQLPATATVARQAIGSLRANSKTSSQLSSESSSEKRGALSEAAVAAASAAAAAFDHLRFVEPIKINGKSLTIPVGRTRVNISRNGSQSSLQMTFRAPLRSDFSLAP